MSSGAGALCADLGELAEWVRREFGDQLPANPGRESHLARERRQEKTKYVLESDVMPRINDLRVQNSTTPLTLTEEDTVVEMVLSSMFLLPHLLGIIDREPLAEDVVALGASPIRVDLADGTQKLYPPMVSEDRAMERVIHDVAEAHHRPFSFEAPFVDVQLSPRLRFHGQGYDVVSRPGIFIRVHRVLGATLDDLLQWGCISSGIAYLLGEVAPNARLSVAFTGVQGSGKTTNMRAAVLAYPETTRILTIETDFELGIASLGRQWTQEMQARIPVTTSARGISCGDLMRPALRTRAELNVIGEVRGDEGGPAIRAANIGQGTMVTVHGDSAEAGLEQLVDRVCEDGTPREIARRMVYKSFDLVVHCEIAPDRARWVSEIIHPLMEGDQPKIHTLYEPSPTAADGRARVSPTSWPPRLLQKITMNEPAFDVQAARSDGYHPLRRTSPGDPADVEQVPA
ncbi:MAG: type II/IV secretion system ATPase subunit [Acidimicrobiia bacterium]|nr:type II/IV secretion system ATPase subunit [Acidimicrobiia bacterium]